MFLVVILEVSVFAEQAKVLIIMCNNCYYQKNDLSYIVIISWHNANLTFRK